ncbi:venom serine protease 34-like isoform X2 [Venturia canescens]|nr:venom serine protease 34-like isoform X2 [Venturia canescens]XP_043288532.1 venom serine protease 34-like isoform X2 [Venturia canescens]XP_043288533.1 venom serine protease 34-like isoform X2 [Venturia canescens]
MVSTEKAHRLRVDCDDMTMPSNERCGWNRLVIGEFASEAELFCDANNYVYLSHSTHLSLELRMTKRGPNGRFRCTISAEPCDCGVRNSPKIYNGVETGVNEFPFMAAIVNDFNSTICGGTIINGKQILTAKHCIGKSYNRNWRVVIGAHSLIRGKLAPSTRYMTIDQINNHATADVAVLTLTHRINFNDAASPVCLPFQRPDDSFGHVSSTYVGWGATNFSNGPVNVLMRTTVNTLMQTECDENLICTQDTRYHNDSCPFDSGGPLIYQPPATEKAIEIGVISRGPDCGTGSPSINVRAGRVLDWIEALVPPGYEYCKIE